MQESDGQIKDYRIKGQQKIQEELQQTFGPQMTDCKDKIQVSSEKITSLQAEILELEKQISEKLSPSAEPVKEDAAAPTIADKHLLVSLGEEEGKLLMEYLELCKENDSAEQDLVSTGDYAQIKQFVEQVAQNEELKEKIASAHAQNALQFGWAVEEEEE